MPDLAARAIVDAVGRAAADNSGTIRTARKAFTAWSRKVQIAGLRPVKGGGAMLGAGAPGFAFACAGADEE